MDRSTPIDRPLTDSCIGQGPVVCPASYVEPGGCSRLLPVAVSAGKESY